MMRAGERGQLLGVDALGEPLERLGPALADPHLGQRQPELLGERAFHVLVELGERGIEAEAGLDAHGEQVERVGKVGLDLFLARPRALSVIA